MIRPYNHNQYNLSFGIGSFNPELKIYLNDKLKTYLAPVKNMANNSSSACFYLQTIVELLTNGSQLFSDIAEEILYPFAQIFFPATFQIGWRFKLAQNNF